MELNQQPTLLVAEDDESNFLLLLTILKKNYYIIRAHDGLEVVQLFKTISPDAILMDINMPNMDGLTATRIIRESDSQVPIIAVSAYVFDQEKQNAYNCGCDAYIVKPIDFRQLKSTISLLLSTRTRIKNEQSIHS